MIVFILVTALALILSHILLFPKTKGVLRSLKLPLKK